MRILSTLVLLLFLSSSTFGEDFFKPKIVKISALECQRVLNEYLKKGRLITKAETRKKICPTVKNDRQLTAAEYDEYKVLVQEHWMLFSKYLDDLQKEGVIGKAKRSQ